MIFNIGIVRPRDRWNGMEAAKKSLCLLPLWFRGMVYWIQPVTKTYVWVEKLGWRLIRVNVNGE